MLIDARLLEKPLPRPEKDLTSYACACTLEALLEAILSLEFLEEGYTSNAASKAFQVWKALVGALLALERDNAEKILGEEEVKWLLETGIPRIPSSRLKPLSQLLEKVGYRGISQATSVALDPHEYQYHGPDASGELSKYPNEERARQDVLILLEVLMRLIEEKLQPRLEKKQAWTQEHQQTLQRLKQKYQALLEQH